MGTTVTTIRVKTPINIASSMSVNPSCPPVPSKLYLGISKPFLGRPGAFLAHSLRWNAAATGIMIANKN